MARAPEPIRCRVLHLVLLTRAQVKYVREALPVRRNVLNPQGFPLGNERVFE